MIRILLAEDHALVRQGIRALLSGLDGVEVVGEANDGKETLKKVQELSPDLVLMDISMPELEGIAATRLIKELDPDIQVLILSVHEDEAFIRESFKAGASGFLIKKLAVGDLEEALHALSDGPPEQFYLPGHLLAKWNIRKPEEWLAVQGISDRLTAREKEVLQWLVKGYNSRQIAEKLFVSVKTIETHRAHLFEKLECNSIASLVQKAIKKGLVL